MSVRFMVSSQYKQSLVLLLERGGWGGGGYFDE